jgi:hypothetical protein
MLNIKETVYGLVSACSIKVTDNPDSQSKEFPYGVLKTTNVINTHYKNYDKANWLLRLDVFSRYKGEKEILDYYNIEILPLVSAVQQLDGITYVKPTLDIVDDKEQGPVTKHGIITLSIETMEV